MSDALEAMLAQYNEDSAPKKAATTNSGGYNKDNYFSERLPKGVNDGTFIIRILPPLEGKKVPYESHNIHSWKIDGKYPKLVCRREIGEDCPVCDAREALWDVGGDNEKEAAKKFNNKKNYVLRLIDRANEDHGVKFWRFGHSYKKDGILDKIMAIVSSMGINVFDAETGQDLVVTVSRDTTNPAVCKVTSVLPKGPSKLSDDETKFNTWLADTRGWQDGIFKPKPYEFLKIVTMGKTPVYDKTSKTYVSADEMEAVEANGGATVSDDTIITMGGGQASGQPAQVTEQPVQTTPQPVQVTEAPIIAPPVEQAPVANTPPVVEEEDDDLPF